MKFNSFEFALFMPLVVLVYWLLPRRGQNRFLLAASYLFYSWWDWRFLSLIMASTCLDYVVGRAIFSSSLNGEATKVLTRKNWLTASIVGNLGILFVFKYFDFFLGSLRDALESLGFETSIYQLGIVLPVGISFYTFQTLSYTLDIYRGEVEPADNFWDFALFVSFFPQLVAGPIERAKRLLPQFLNDRQLRLTDFLFGLHLIVWGLFMKLFVADSLAPIVDKIYAQTKPTGSATALATLAFAFQIYSDFAGYSLVARGAAKCLGIELMRNFDHPYFALSLREFWRRWHISLSSWFRDYLYIPLGGARRGRLRTYVNLFLTMLICGIWHGAAWTFILWGAYHGMLLALNRFFHERRASKPSVAAWLAGPKWLLTFGLVCLGWVIFRSQSLNHLGTRLMSLVFSTWQLDWELVRNLLLTISPLLALELLQFWSGIKDWYTIPWLSAPVKGAIYGFLVYLMITRSVQTSDFIYFQF